jgi:flagellar biosynthesis GTPase FlhF
MLPQMRDMLVPQGASKDPFEKTIENFRLFKMMQREFAESSPQQSQQQDQDNFWSFAKGLLQSDVGKSIAAQIMQQGAANEMAQHQQQRIAQQQAQARAVAQRRAQQAAQQRQLAETRAQQLTDGARRAEAEAKAAEKEAADAKARAEAEAQAAQAERRVAQAEQPQSQEDGDEEGLFVPPGFLEVNAQKINGASNDAELIGEIITGFQVLATSPDFRPVMTKMFGLCKLNRRIEALEHLREILEFFAENEVLDPAVIQRAVAGFDQHWKIIRARLEFPDVPEVFPEGHPQAVAAAPAKEEAVEAAQ